MESPEEPVDDRRAVPRHLRDGEHELVGFGIFGMRAGDARGARAGRTWLLLVFALAVAGAGVWYALGR